MSAVVNTSLCAIGTPASGPSGAPAARCSSTARAAARARSAATCRNAFTRPVHRGDPVQVGLGDLDRGDLARGHRRGQVGRGLPG